MALHLSLVAEGGTWPRKIKRELLGEISIDRERKVYKKERSTLFIYRKKTQFNQMVGNMTYHMFAGNVPLSAEPDFT